MSVPKPKRKTDECPCGSGKQYRYCHGAPPEEADEGPVIRGNRRQVFLWVIAIGAPLAYAIGMFQPSATEGGQKRVWSEEHGHYHDVDGGELGATAEPAPAAAAPAEGEEAAAATEVAAKPTKAPGPTPPGKVWSPEHGHWHDVDGAKGGDPERVLVDPVSGKPWDHGYELDRPEGEAPEGMTWSAAHGHWHPNQ